MQARSPDLAWLIGLTALAALLRLPTLGSQSFWSDEAITVQLVHMDAVHMLRGVGSGESTPPLYYALAWVWARVFGFDEAGLRSLSAVLGIAMVPVSYAAASALVSRRAGLIVAALVATSPFMVWYSQEARSYALVALAAAAGLWFFARSLDGFGRRALAGWAAASIVALVSHYGAVLLVAPEAAWLLVRAGSRRRAAAWAVAAVGAVGALLVPLAVHQHVNADWIGDYAFGGRLAEVPRVFAGGVTSPSLWLTVAIGLVWAGAIALALVQRSTGVALALAAAGLATALVLAAAGSDIVLARNLIVLWLPVAVFAAAGLAGRAAGTLGLVAAGAAAALSAGIVMASDSNDRLQRPDWRAAADALGPAPSPRVVVAPGGFRAEGLRLHLHGTHYTTRSQALRVGEVDLVGFHTPSGYACWSGRACNMPRTLVRAVPPVPGFRLVEHRRAGFFEVVRFKASRPATVRPAQLVTSTDVDAPLVLLQD